MKILTSFLGLLFYLLGISTGVAEATNKILLIPLDDRPPCLQFPVKMAQIDGIELVTPPKALLGRFMRYGEPDEIIKWIERQNLTDFDAAIISLDMLAYGGLVASRVFATPLELAKRRISIVGKLRALAPHLRIYGSSVIMRLAPTADGANDSYRTKLAKWAEISPNPSHRQQTLALEKAIPVQVLEDYKNARLRNLIINQLAVEYAKSKVFDYLIISQDDAKPSGIHLADRDALVKMVAEANLANRVAIQPGADEVSMLLLARSVSDRYAYHPRVFAYYGSEKSAQTVMPFEDRTLRKTVSFHLKAVGALEVFTKEEADIVFFVFSDRLEGNRSMSYAHEISEFHQRQSGIGLILADIDPIGNVQGGDQVLTECLNEMKIFKNLYGYASWNTAGNAIGTALPQGIVYGAALKRNTQPEEMKRSATAQGWFILNRLMDDYLYHAKIRPEALQFIKAKGWNSLLLNTQQTIDVEHYCLERINAFSAHFYGFNPKEVSFYLPWSRTFEAEISFE
ncbi:uncharacterized protein DUF4127 [Dyadobacter jejuensis]|uniref:Uncharacterized protein DUF4127 n=1 Tax=Dyadobacter jejuensis TaxID=1082580 RepID=A0A316AUX2_9BACT|nr:DUF4127 family protein [Dyadobacter jejuensis]PWJ53897.1 uncharacterized protein DUF4127 [Dyadobacter jejuensis]